MKDEHLYQRIAEHIRQQILEGKYQPGERLPAIRQLTAIWGCTPGTIQRAYQALAQEGLIASRVGQGTRVLENPVEGAATNAGLRQVRLVHRAESFLLESLNTGYTMAEIERGLVLALDHTRQVAQESQRPLQNLLRFAGSNDLLVSWIAAHASEIMPGWRLEVSFSGSLGGLIALSTGKADLAGCHLWDSDGENYNTAYVRRLLPGQRAAVIILAERRQGLMLAAGNPKQVGDLADLARGDIQFVNRQAGSGTRVWLDTMLRARQIAPSGIQGYEKALMTHSEVARLVAEGKADVGLGFEGAAYAFGLDFVPLTLESYELVTVERIFEQPVVQDLVHWLGSEEGKQQIASQVGYNAAQSGNVRWVG
jgi:putative molybdopterin biosynthesis protein